MSVTLVVPNRNNAAFLHRCLESALAQSLPFAEIIVVDDASEDESLALLAEVANRNRTVRVISLPQRQGVAAARDIGIRAATSSHVSTLDADDFICDSRKNEREWAIIASAPDPELTIAFSDVCRVGVDGMHLGLVSKHRAVREGRIFWHMLFLRGFVPRDFTVSRAPYFAVGGYDRSFSIYEDWDLKLRLARRCIFKFTGECGIAYRDNPTGLSKSSLAHHISAMRRVAWKNTCEMPPFGREAVRAWCLLRILWFLRGRLKQKLPFLMRTR